MTAPTPTVDRPDYDGRDHDGFETGGLDEYTTPAHLAQGMAWEVLTHWKGMADQIAAVIALPLPPELEDQSEDMFEWLYELIADAGRIGYIVAKFSEWDRSGFEYPKEWPAAQLTSGDLTKMILALMRRPATTDGIVIDDRVRAIREARAAA